MKEKHQPPKNFQSFFTWFCHDDYMEELAGDLEESFFQNIEEQGLIAARNIYRKEVIKMLRPSVIKNIRLPQLIPMHLLQNYFKIAFRNFARHKFFSFINLTGLAIGMCLSLLVIGMIYDLSRFDEFHEHKDRIYRVISHTESQNWSSRSHATSSMPLAQEIEASIPAVEKVIKIRRFFSGDVDYNNRSIFLRGHMVDQNFLNTFTFPLLEGNVKNALVQPYSVVLTETAAQKLFGDQNPMGALIEVADYGTYAITGIAKDPPKFSHIQFDMLGSFSTIPTLEKEEKINPTLAFLENYQSNYTYLLVKNSQDAHKIEKAINDLSQSMYKAIPDITMETNLQALTAIVPGPELNNQIGPNIPYIVLIILSLIALVVLLSACFNYTNLSIARSLKRAREIGIRKVVGARKGEIVIQFLCESVLLALFAVVVSIGLFHLIKPGFLSLLPKNDLFQLQHNPTMFLLFLAFAIVAGLMAGAFPAFFLSSMKPVQVFKNLVHQKLFKKLTVRKILIVFQFVISTSFIIATSIIYSQYKFAISKDMGFARENILNVYLDNADRQVFETEFAKIPEVKQISFASLIPGGNSTAYTWVQMEEGKDSLSTCFFYVDENFISNHQLNLIAGNNFTEQAPNSEIDQLIVNQQFLKNTAWEEPSEAVGQWVNLEGKKQQIVGVIQDFNYNHIEEPIRRFCFRYKPDWCHIANLKIATHDLPATMRKLESTWKTIGPTTAFNAHFLDQQIEETYQFLVNIMSIFGFVAFLAISIACLGLLGMAVYTTETKLKEISIRKIFGASRSQLVLQLSNAFVLLLIIASFIAIPVTYLLFDQVVLNNFAFRIQIGVLELSSGFVIILVLGLLTLGSQTWKAANTNPAEHLRGE